MSYFTDADSERGLDCPHYEPPSVSHQAFTFEGGKFYVSFHRGSRYVRAKPTELYRLITGSPSPATTLDVEIVKPDSERDYYAAQMIHYGLGPITRRDQDKQCLLAAFGDSQTLQVPQAILDLEAEMKKKWEALNAEYTANQARERLRVAQEKPDEVKFKLDPPIIEQSAKPELFLPKMTPDETGTAIASLSLVRAKQVLENFSVSQSSTVRAALKQELFFIKENGKAYGESSVDPSVWTGLYNVEIPSKVDRRFEYEEAPSLTFEIYPSSSSCHLWALFDFGFLSGFMRSKNSVPNALDTKVHFRYRGYEHDKDTMTFDEESNSAIIIFLPGGFFEGEIATDCSGNLKIYGTLKNRGNCNGTAISQCKTPAQQKAAIKQWKTGYRRINKHNSEVISFNRWIHWDGQYRDDEAFESDTTAGEEEHHQLT